MKKLLLVCFMAAAPVLAFAQGYGGFQQKSSIKGRITGVVTDGTTNQPVEFATVAVKRPGSDKIVGGAVADAQGAFKIAELPVGNYEVLFSFMGYEGKTMPVELTKAKPDIDLGAVTMASTAAALDEVVVTGERDIIETKIDRLVYNAEDDVANVGGNAADVLRRAPLLSVDLDGNVSLRGSSNVTILVNGKLSSLFQGDVAAALNALPADQIERVEVITTPSAKYDGEGSAGIINIITKKDRLEGVAGSVRTSIGNRVNNLNLNLNTGKGRFGTNLGLSSWYTWRRPARTEFERIDELPGGTRSFTEDGISNTTSLGGFLNGGAFYDFNAFHSLNASFRARGFFNDNKGEWDTQFTDPLSSLNQTYARTSDNSSLNSGYEASLDYIARSPASEKQEFSLSYKLDGSVTTSDFVITQGDALGTPSLFRNEENQNLGNNLEHTIQLNYAHPFGEKVLVETGAKGVLRRLVSDYNYLEQATADDPLVVDESRSDIFYYNQDVYAGFVSTTINFTKKTGLIAGVRYETTDIGGEFRDNEIEPFSFNYDNLLPSVVFSHNFGKAGTYKLAYNQRIQRPGLRFVNPYVVLDNNRNISFGNPDLQPEISNQYELQWNTFIKRSLINASLFYRQTTDVIESYLTVDEDGVSQTTFRNIGQNNSIGVNLFTSFTLWKIWTLRGGTNVFTYNASGTVDGRTLSNQALLFNGNINSNLKLPKDYVIDVFGFYRAPRQTLQGVIPSFSIISIGARKTFNEGKGSIGLRMVEPWSRDKFFGSELSGVSVTDGGEEITFYQRSDRWLPFRSLGINFTYNFGSFKGANRRRSKINNDDVLQDGGGQGGGQF